MTNPSRGRARALSILLTAVAFAVLPVPSRAELPPEARAAFNKGLIAAQQQDWRLAELSFQEARRSAPSSPELFYNLGLTESKMPGRELRAIAWLSAYLAANPKAVNATVVNALIDQLQVKNESNIVQLITTMQKAVLQLPSGENKNLGDIDLYPSYRVAMAWANFGDYNAAQGVIDLMPTDDCCGAKGIAERDLGLARADATKANEEAAGHLGEAVSACDWAQLLEVRTTYWCTGGGGYREEEAMSAGSLNESVFLDLPGYLSTWHTDRYEAGDPRQSIFALVSAASELAVVDQRIGRMVVRQRSAGAQTGKTK